MAYSLRESLQKNPVFLKDSLTVERCSAQSVLGAVQGLDVIVPNISHGVVIGTSCGILILLFLVQRFGTTKIGVTFAPIG